MYTEPNSLSQICSTAAQRHGTGMSACAPTRGMDSGFPAPTATLLLVPATRVGHGGTTWPPLQPLDATENAGPTWKKKPQWYGLPMVDFMWCRLWWYAVLIQGWCASGHDSSKPQCR